MGFIDLNQQQWQEIGISLAIVLITLFIGRWLIHRLLIPLLKRLSNRTKTSLDDDLLEVAEKPIFWLLLLFAIQFAITRLDFLADSFSLDLSDVYFLAYFYIFFVLAWRAANTLSEWFQTEFAKNQNAELAQQLAPFISRIILILLAALGAIILLDHFNVEVSGLVATLGIGSLAIALAAQAALADTISGFIIMIDRPYRIGDRIEILELKTWGDVTNIGLRSTRIRTRDNRMAVVPNSVIAKNMVVNHSFPDDKYRLQTELGISEYNDLEIARKVIIEAVENVEGVLKGRPVEALFLRFGDSELIIRVRWWLDSYVDTRRMYDRVNSAIFAALRKNDIALSTPERDINLSIDSTTRENLGRTLQED